MCYADHCPGGHSQDSAPERKRTGPGIGQVPRPAAKTQPVAWLVCQRDERCKRSPQGELTVVERPARPCERGHGRVPPLLLAPSLRCWYFLAGKRDGALQPGRVRSGAGEDCGPRRLL